MEGGKILTIRKIKLSSIFALVIVATWLFVVCLLNKEGSISTILSGPSYAYLSTEAKEYITKVYEETGEVIKTEKNKEENQPYLNPEFIGYLELNEEEKKQVELIPDTYSIDYVSPIYNVQTNNYESTYDLRNVNGNSYITPLKDQGNLGLCWAFASVEQAESFLMVSEDEPYNPSTQKFSVRQMDYALSTDGIKNYNNENGMRSLTRGGNFYYSTTIMSNGLSLVDDGYMPYNETEAKKELNQVLSYDKSMYEVDSTIILAGLDNDYTASEFEEYNNLIKTMIKNYGGAYVGTGAPSGTCAAENIDGSYVIDDSYGYNSCDHNNGDYGAHAMQIIGWDDNYEYKYCPHGRIHSKLNINDSLIDKGMCDGGYKIRSGKGAWILRNSWGDDPSYKYAYLTYDSVRSSIGAVTSLSKTNKSNWDNNYKSNYVKNKLGMVEKSDSAKFEKPINSDELVKKIKFISFGYGATYTISVKSDNERYDNIKEFTVDYPGLYTVDLSENDIAITDDNFEVSIESLNDTFLLSGTISVFTSNIDKTPIIATDDIVEKAVFRNNLNTTVYSDTKNISAGESVEYHLYKDGADVTDRSSITNNVVAENNINVSVAVDKDVGYGNYVLKAIYDGHEFSSSVTFEGAVFDNGDGSSFHPYQITNEEQLKALKYDTAAYYELVNDIELTEEWIPAGTPDNPFSGYLDGKNHTISGLKVSEENIYGGLIGYAASGTNTAYIKNLTIRNAEVSGRGAVGGLIGQLNLESDNFIIDNVFIIGGNISSEMGDAGALIGKINKEYNYATMGITNVFSSADVYGSNSAGLIGSADNVNFNPMDKIQNVGIINANDWQNDNNENLYGTLIGSAKNINGHINESIITSLIKNRGNIYGHVLGINKSALLHDLDLSSGFYLKTQYDYDDFDFVLSGDLHATYPFIDMLGVQKASEINKKIQEYFGYEKFEDIWHFSANWKMETIDDIPRIPVLKGVDFEYSSMSNIELSLGDEVSLLDYITPEVDAARIHYELKDNEDRITITDTKEDDNSYPSDIKLRAVNAGETTIHIINNYDGYENDINVKINKIDPNFDIPTGIVGRVGEKLSDITLPSGFEWVDPNFQLDNTGEIKTMVIYIPSNTNNFNIIENIEVIVQVKENNYSITYDANGGTGIMNPQQISYNASAKLSQNMFIRLGSIFTGWNTKADGTGTAYENEQLISLSDDLTLYAQWSEGSPYTIDKYNYDEVNDYVNGIPVNTTVDAYRQNIGLLSGYTADVESKTINNEHVLYTGGKTRIYMGQILYIELTNIVTGDTNGDGKINYLDYVNVYNHIQKTKHPENNKKLLMNEYLLAADMSNDDKISYLDYVRIYNKIKELKGESN